jgi:P-type Ca2+ transporter type 2A
VIDEATGHMREYLVEGTTFAPHGLVKGFDGSSAPSPGQSNIFRRIAEISACCNDSEVVYNEVRVISHV